MRDGEKSKSAWRNLIHLIRTTLCKTKEAEMSSFFFALKARELTRGTDVFHSIKFSIFFINFISNSVKLSSGESLKQEGKFAVSETIGLSGSF